MARTSFTTIYDINYISKNKNILIFLLKKIKTENEKNIDVSEKFNYFLLFEKYLNDLIKLIDIIKIFALRRPVIFRKIDLSYIESIEISLKEMKNESQFDKNFINQILKKFLNFLIEKENKYKKIYGIND